MGIRWLSPRLRGPLVGNVELHELGIASEIIEVARAAASGRSGFRASRIEIRVGSLQAIDPDSLKFAFEVLAGEDPVFRRAVLDVVVDQACFECGGCGWTGPEPGPAGACPGCKSADLRISGGIGIVLQSVEGTEDTEGDPDPGDPREGRGSGESNE